MALFVFGAGATKGCSFVNAEQNCCVPPLDADFYTQLQRIQNPKHKDLIDSVCQDAVLMFGLNFKATLEQMYTTLEHSIKLIDAIGKSGQKRRATLVEKMERLELAIAAVLEDSLTVRGVNGACTVTNQKCTYLSLIHI